MPRLRGQAKVTPGYETQRRPGFRMGQLNVTVAATDGSVVIYTANHGAEPTKQVAEQVASADADKPPR